MTRPHGLSARQRAARVLRRLAAVLDDRRRPLDPERSRLLAAGLPEEHADDPAWREMVRRDLDRRAREVFAASRQMTHPRLARRPAHLRPVDDPTSLAAGRADLQFTHGTEDPDAVLRAMYADPAHPLRVAADEARARPDSDQ